MGSRAIAPLVTPILKDLALSYGQMGFILGSWQFMYVFSSLVAGTILDRWGIRWSLLLGILIVSFSLLFRSLADSFVSLLLMVVVFGAGASIISIGTPKAIALWFRGKDRGAATGFCMTGPSIGYLIALTITNSLLMPLTGYSWRLTFASYGLFAFVISVLWFVFTGGIRTRSSTHRYAIPKVLHEIAKVRNVRVLALLGLCSFAILHGWNNWVPKILESRGLSPVWAANAASISVVCGIASAILLPRLIPSFWRARFVGILALLAATSGWLVTHTTGPGVFLGLVLIGVAGGCFLPLEMLILMETPEVDAKYLGTAGGLFFSVAQVGGVCAPLLVGVLVDASQPFRSAAYVITFLAIVIVLLTLLIDDKSSLHELEEGREGVPLILDTEGISAPRQDSMIP